ncbi:hypothetical protein ACYZUD_10500 [Pseudomonas sp. XS1P51]
MKRLFCCLSLALAGSAVAADCDCQKVIGSCLGSIEFVKAYGSKPSFGADLIIHSSEKKCSKVQFVVGSTPYQTILANKNTEPESVFGTSQISAKSITFESCKVCSSVASGGRDARGDKDSNAADSVSYDLSGTWSMTQTCSWGTGNSEMQVQHNQSTGRITGNLSNAKIDSGSIQGNSVHMTASHWLGNKVQMEGQIISPTQMKGSYTQTKSSETCGWAATKSS